MTNSLIRITGIYIGDNEIKIVNCVHNTTIFLKDITCPNKIKVILKLYEDASTLKINFSKAKPHGPEHIKIDMINQKK